MWRAEGVAKKWQAWELALHLLQLLIELAQLG
jgi:hypothetical protein